MWSAAWHPVAGQRANGLVARPTDRAPVQGTGIDRAEIGDARVEEQLAGAVELSVESTRVKSVESGRIGPHRQAGAVQYRVRRRELQRAGADLRRAGVSVLGLVREYDPAWQ